MGSGPSTHAGLRDEVKQALLSVLRDKKSSAAAKASAGKTLLENYGAAEEGANWLKPVGEMSESEIDRELELRKKAQ